MNFYLGTQGWSYRDWAGPFYPPDARPRDYLAMYAAAFDAVEVDSTFYATPRSSLVDLWDSQTPSAFQFAAKTPRSITHDRHLIDVNEDMAEFLRVITRLGEKLGAVLIQMPPDFSFDELPALDAFLATLPDEVRFAVELRHRSWIRDESFDLLRDHGAAFTIVDLHYMPRIVELTADFAYVRWLGDRRQIQRMHTTQIDRRGELDQWAERLEDLSSRAQRIYGFSNNHYSGHSPSDISHLRRRLGLPERTGPRQGTLL